MIVFVAMPATAVVFLFILIFTMTIFSAKGLSKTYDRDVLFENVSFGMEQFERVGLIGRNGIGKSTLLRIIAGLEYPDSGEVIFNSNVTFEFLEQNPLYDSYFPVIDEVMSGRQKVFGLLKRHAELCKKSLESGSTEFLEFQEITHKIDHLNAWNLESDSKAVLHSLGIDDYSKPCNTLSGGQRKRVALAKVLISAPDLLIMDEPTNHLDADSVQWLQDYIQNTAKTILFITHDRYFLDAVSTKIIELDQKKIFAYNGNYEEYLEKKANYISAVNATAEHTKSRLVKEMAWLAKGAKARRTKQKSRIDWISKMTLEMDKIEEKNIKIELGKSFLGNRIIDANYITKSIGGKLLFKEFTYNAKPGDKLGFIGPNGCGKSTLLNVLAGKIKQDAGELKIGESVKIGYYSQELTGLDDNKTLLATLREVAEYIDCGVGRDRYLTARDLLNKFLFPPEQHHSLVSTLSGGEKRRLALIKVLMLNPNVIFLDEPTNDLDIQTLNVLEDYLDDFYGVLVVVSHDRAFLDRTIQFIHAFEENGKIKEYPGNYSFYLERKEEAAKGITKAVKPKSEYKNIDKSGKKKLSYQEKIEHSRLIDEIEKLEIKKGELQEQINNSADGDYKLIQEMCLELDNVINDIDRKTERWIELEEKNES